MAFSEKTFLRDYDFAVVGSASEGPGLSYVYPGARPADAAAAAESERSRSGVGAESERVVY